MSLGQGVKGNSQSEMVDSLKKSNVVQSEYILAALRDLDRKWFVSEK